MFNLQLYFLGSLQICSDGRLLLNPPTQKSQSLLAYLVIHRSQPQPRDRLAGLFFGERPERKAHRSLSTALWHIHRSLPDEFALLNDSHAVQFDPHSHLWLDLEEFKALASRADPAALQSAIALYRGDFLDGFYDDWIISERYRLEALYLEALTRLMDLNEARRDYPAALSTALGLLDRDFLREDAHRLAMRAYCHLGQRRAALEQYARCRQTLSEELNIVPMIETTQLYQAILQGRFEASPLPDSPRILTRPLGPAGRNPLDVAPPPRLVGREQEMLFLEDCWRRAQAGNSSLALIRGEAGVGKTRLVEEFAYFLHNKGIRVLWGRCYEFERAIPYQPVAEALRTCLPALPHDELAGFPAWVLKEVARLVPGLLERPGLEEAHPELDRKITRYPEPEPELPGSPGLDPEQARLFEGATRFLAELSSQAALMVVLEDLHWASESTLQLLHYLARYLADYPVLIVGTFRVEAIDRENPLSALQSQLAREGIAHRLDLPRLSPASVSTILFEMSRAGEAVKPLAECLYRETEGNPFFLMESIKALFETNLIQLKEGVWRGDFTRICDIKLPLSASLSEAVQRRVQRLREMTQEALCLAAVLGREFNFEPFHEAWGKGEEATLEALDELLRHKLVEEKSGPQDSDFAFAHHKIQEVVYQGLPRHRCLHLHARVGAAMETVYAAELETRTGELAHHFEQACLLDRSLSGKAIHYLLRAGQQAARQSANQEAINYYQRGLDILYSQPETEERMQQEIELQIALAMPIRVMQGYASPEIKRIYDRASHLCQKLGDSPDLFTSLDGLTRYYGLTGDFDMAIRLGEQMLTIAQSTRETGLLLEAYRHMGGHMLIVGRLTEARKYWEDGLKLYDPAMHESLAGRFGHDPAVAFLGYLSIVPWMQGYPDLAQEQSQILCRLMQSIVQPSSLAVGHCLLAKQASMRRDADTALEHAEEAIDLGQVHGLTSWTSLAKALKGWALCEKGRAADGLALLNEGIRSWQAMGFVHFTPFLISLEAEACLKLQMLKEGTDAVMAALEIGRRGDQYWKAEIHRLQGDLLHACNADDRSVEACFHQAMLTARQQSARMLELRAAVSLARLWQGQGQRKAAQQMLSEIYEWFTEGFDTDDVKAASTLLQELL